MPRQTGSGSSPASKKALDVARLRNQLNSLMRDAAAAKDPRIKLDHMKAANVISDTLGNKRKYSETDIEAVNVEIKELKKNIYKELKAERRLEKPKAPKKKKAAKVDEPESNIMVRKQLHDEPEPAEPKKPGRPKGSKKAVGNVAEVLDGEAQKARVAPLEREELTRKIIEDYSKELDKTKKHVEEMQSIVKRHLT